MEAQNTITNGRSPAFSWTWKDRLRFRLFPVQYCDLPEAPPSFKDVVISHSRIELSIVDRFRALISGRLQCEMRIATENIVGSTRTKSEAFVLPPKWMERAERK